MMLFILSVLGYLFLNGLISNHVNKGEENETSGY